MADPALRLLTEGKERVSIFGTSKQKDEHGKLYVVSFKGGNGTTQNKPNKKTTTTEVMRRYPFPFLTTRHQVYKIVSHYLRGAEVSRRYSEFAKLHKEIETLHFLCLDSSALPKFPGKKPLGKLLDDYRLNH